MKQLKLLFTVLFLAVLGLGNVWAEEEVFYTNTCPKNTSASTYATYYDVTVAGIKWKAPGNQYADGDWRLGGKSSSSVDRYLYTQDAIETTVTKIVATHGSKNASSVGNVKLDVYSTAALAAAGAAGDVSSLTAAYVDNGSITFTCPAGADWKDRFYRLTYPVNPGSTSSNKYAPLKKVEFYYNAEEPTCSTPDITFAEGAEVAKLTTDAAFTNAASVKFESTATGQTITYSVEDGKEGVATVNASTGEVTIVGAGEAKIYASVAADGDYCEKSAYYTLTVTAPVVPTGTFTKYTGATLVEGDYIICVGTDAMKNSVTSSRLDYASVTVTTNAIVNPDATVIWHIAPSATDGYFTMYNEVVEKYAASTGAANKAQLLESGTDDKSLWSVAMPTIETYNFENKQNKTNNVNAKLQKNGTYGFACYASYSNITLYAKLGSYAISKASCTNGSVDVTGIADLSQVVAGTTVTLTNTPATGYKLAAYSVVDAESNPITVTDGKFTMPASNVTVSATFEVAKVLDGTDLTLGGEYPTEFWKGETFSHAGLTASAHFNTGAADVTDDVTFSTPDMSTAGTKTITVTYTEGGASQTATYDIEVKTIANTQETAYTTAKAIALIVAGKDLSTEVYVKGKVSQVDSYNSEYKSITYWLDANAFEVYGGLAGTLFNGAFSSKDDIAVGADVIVKGTITDFKKNGVHQAYEFNSNNVLVYYQAPEVVKENPTLTLTGNKTAMSADDADNEFTVSYDGDGELSVVSSDEAKATVTIDGTTVTVHPIAAGATTITVSAAETEAYNAISKTYTLTVAAGLSAAVLPFEFDGGKADMDLANGIKNTGLGSDYSASPKLKFDGGGDEVVIRVADAIKKVEYTIKGAPGSGAWAGQFDVLQSADGKTYTTLASHTSMATTATKMTSEKPAADTRYIKFVLTTKTNGNVALGAIKISAASELDSPELAFGQESYTFFADAASMQVSATSAAGSEGAISYALTNGDADAFSVEAATGVITCETAGTYTVTATIAATAAFAEQSVNVVVTINEAEDMGDAISIVFPYGETFYAMKKDLSVVEVLYADNKLYNIAEADKAGLTWYKKVTDGNVVFRNAEGKYIGTGSSNSIVLSETAVNWTYDSEKGYYYCGEATTRTFLLKDEATVKNYAVSNAGSVGYSEKPVFATEFATAELLGISLSGEYTTEFSVGDAFEHEGLIVTANYEGGSSKVVTEEATFSTPDMNTVGEQTVTVSFGGKEKTYTINITALVPTISVDKTTLAFGTVNKDATVEAKTVAVTLENLAAATVAISGEGAAKFAADVTSLTASGDVTISVTTDEAGTYAATLTISGEGAESKEVALSMTVVDPSSVTEEMATLNEGYTNGQAVTTYTGATFTITYAKADGSTAPAYYTTGNAIRIYTGNTVTITANADRKIYMVEVAYSGTNTNLDNTTLANNNHGYVVCDGTSNIVTLTNSSASQSRITGITVYYADQKEEVRGGLSVGKFGTICVEKMTLAPAGAHFYTLNQYDVANQVLTVTENTTGRLEAGVPYIFEAEGNEIGGVVVANEESASDKNGLYAVLGSDYIADGSEYGIVGNQVRPASAGAIFKVGRCYIKLGEVPTESQGAAPARAFRVIGGTSVATGFEGLEAIEGATKLIYNGQIVILRDGKCYDTVGRIIK